MSLCTVALSSAIDKLMASSSGMVHEVNNDRDMDEQGPQRALDVKVMLYDM